MLLHVTHRIGISIFILTLFQEGFLFRFNKDMLATSRDVQAAVMVIGVFGFFSIVGVPRVLLRSVLAYPIPVRIAWIAIIVYFASCRYFMTAVLIALLGLYVSFQVTSSFAFSSEGILEMYRAAQENDPRFDQANELDLKMAEGTLQFDPARWRDPGRAPVPLLLFPPTLDQLKMIGSA
jgi:hypothetical protein